MYCKVEKKRLENTGKNKFRKLAKRVLEDALDELENILITHVGKL